MIDRGAVADPPLRVERSGQWSRRRPRMWPARIALGVYLLLAAGLTVGPLPEQRMLDALVAMIGRALGAPGGIHEQVVEAPSNVLLFVPLGFLLCRAVRLGWASVWALCVLGSVSIEVAQALFLPLRTASLVDVATNSLGAAIGIAVHVIGTRRVAGQSVRQQ